MVIFAKQILIELQGLCKIKLLWSLSLSDFQCEQVLYAAYETDLGYELTLTRYLRSIDVREELNVAREKCTWCSSSSLV